MSDIEDLGKAVLIKINDTKTKKQRSFTITGEFLKIFAKYTALRPQGLCEQRFFLNFQKNKCTRQVVGVNKIGSIPKQVALFLQLKNPEQYTGHSYRRSSATILVDAGADLATLKRHGGWRSSTVAEGYIGDSLNNKINIADKISNSISESTFSKIQKTPSSTITSSEFETVTRNIPEESMSTNINNAADVVSQQTETFPAVSTEYNNSPTTHYWLQNIQ